jgi:hypothetical protein
MSRGPITVKFRVSLCINPDGIIPGHASKPYFNFISRTGPDKNTITPVEMAESENNHEIVNLHRISDAGRKRKEEKGRKENDAFGAGGLLPLHLGGACAPEADETGYLCGSSRLRSRNAEDAGRF